METPRQRALAPGTVALPLGEVLRIANEYERASRLTDAQRLLNQAFAEPAHGDALHLAGIVAFRQGDIARALDLMERSLRHAIRTPLYSTQHMRSLSHAGTAG
jgi:Tfp pilus assembly protein PilF